MAEVYIRHQWIEQELRRLQHGYGGIERDMMRRGYRVQRQAQAILTRTGRVDHGRLRSSITVQAHHTGSGLIVSIGTNVFYAMWVEEGTGLYGPRHAKIRPRRPGGVMVFQNRKAFLTGVYIPGRFRTTFFVRSTKGMRGVHFLRDALPAARG